MKKWSLVPDGWECTLRECPPGLFAYAGGKEWGFRSEYGNNDGKIDAYCSSGEFFCGDPDASKVIPLQVEEDEE